MTKAKNDFTIDKWVTLHGEQRWRVIVAGRPLTVCHNLKHAQYLAKNLNIDHWFMDRGQTRIDRVASENLR